MVWQDGETIVGNLDLLRLRLQIVSDNLVHKKLIPPMVHVLISPGSGGEAQGTRMRSIQYDTVSDRYSKYLLEEILAGSREDLQAPARRVFASHRGRFVRSDLRVQRRLVSTRSVQPRPVAHRQLRAACNGIPSSIRTAAISCPPASGASRGRIFACGYPTGPTTRKATAEAGR